jgi:hypothetical protein
VDGIPALVAAMDGNNDAIFTAGDYWSVLQASAPDAAKSVLSHTEARETNRRTESWVIDQDDPEARNNTTCFRDLTYVIESSGTSGPVTAIPVSSRVSRRAASSRGSSGSGIPLGMPQGDFRL